jgi:hypothetical protein
MTSIGNRIAVAAMVGVTACVGLTFSAAGSAASGGRLRGEAPPQTKILKAKKNRKHGFARFRFTSSEPGSTFRCKLDDRRFRSCSSPMAYRHLKIGRHAFRVRATDTDGVADPTPARRRFFIGRGPGAGPPFPPFKHVEPARMIGGGACTYGNSEVFWPIRNGWSVANRGRQTIVCAGGAGLDGPSKLGRFLILRTNFRWVTQGLSFVDVPHSGPLKITKAPLGRDVITSAQWHGRLEFKGTNGVTGTLHLKHDSITLDQ